MTTARPTRLSARNVEIKRRYAAGETALAIGRAFGLTKVRVCQILKRYGASMRPRGRTPKVK